MKAKIEEKYVYHGLGFPITLYNVPMIEIEGQYHPKIDVQKVADEAIEALVFQKERLSGDQIKFIRSYFLMSLRDFAKMMNESHMAVKKWEDFGTKQTSMDPNIEKILRLNVLDNISIKKTKLSKTKVRQSKIQFYEYFAKITEIFANVINRHRKSDDSVPVKKSLRVKSPAGSSIRSHARPLKAKTQESGAH